MREAVPLSVEGCGPEQHYCPQSRGCLRVTIARDRGRFVVDHSTADLRQHGCPKFLDRRGASLLQSQGRAA